MPISGLRIRLHAATAALLVAAIVTVSWTRDARAEDGDRPYLALGDSVVFGFLPEVGPEYVNAQNFVGYPDYVGAALRLATVNASCPGEATGGFISLLGQDNGCFPFRFQLRFPLHTFYTSAQLDFATRFLETHPNTKLVTIGLGANDVFLCLADPQCAATGLPQVFATISSNMQTILSALRATGFNGVLVVVNYYSLDYSDPVGTFLTHQLNDAVTFPARAKGAVIADVFTAFANAARVVGGRTCFAGLLKATPRPRPTDPLCDVHPSQSGQKLLADTVEKAYKAAIGADGGDD